MPELLLQAALTASRSKHLATEAAQIRANCQAQHGDSRPLVTCSDCYGTLLEAYRARFLNPTAAPPDQPQLQQQQQQTREWLTARRAFLSNLDLSVSSAKEYQIPPQAVDDRVREERSRWYAETVRGSLLRLMVEDPAGQGVVFEKLEDLSSATAAADPVVLAREIAEILSKGPLAPDQGPAVDLPQKLAAAGDGAATVDVLKEAFFSADDGTVPEDHRKYLDLLRHQGLSMEQVVDRMLEERQTATGAKEQTGKLNQRLDELRRARAAHEAQKTRKAQRRESLAQQKVPDELYELPDCAVCGEPPSTADFFCCGICAIFVGAGIREKQTVFCSEKCEQQGHASHAETHTCSSAQHCVRLRPPSTSKPATNTTSDQDTPMTEASPQLTDLRFCAECLTSLKQPTTWCSLACADADFPRHREGVHLPERKKLGLDADGDEAQLEDVVKEDGNTDAGGGGGGRKYRARDISALTTSLEDAVREWEGRHKVRLQVPT